MDEYLSWAKIFAVQKDAFKKEILNVEISNDFLKIIKKKSIEKYISVGKNNIRKIYSKNTIDCDLIWFVCDNSTSKIKEILDLWEEIKLNNKIRFIFLNIKDGNKWLLNPYSHALVIDEENLENSLISISNNI